MQMRRLHRSQFASALLVLALASTGYARVGETRAECEKRYGTLTPGKFNEHENAESFEKGSISGSLIFDGSQADAKCVLLQVTRNDMTPLGKEIRVVMEANKGDSEWSKGKRSETPLGPRWDFTTRDGRLHAFVIENAMLGHLTIQSCEWRDRLRNAKDQKEKEAVSGF
jgi:hypothetical protein